MANAHFLKLVNEMFFILVPFRFFWSRGQRRAQHILVQFGMARSTDQSGCDYLRWRALQNIKWNGIHATGCRRLRDRAFLSADHVTKRNGRLNSFQPVGERFRFDHPKKSYWKKYFPMVHFAMIPVKVSSPFPSLRMHLLSYGCNESYKTVVPFATTCKFGSRLGLFFSVLGRIL